MSLSWGLKDSDTCLSHHEIGVRVYEPIWQLGSKLDKETRK